MGRRKFGVNVGEFEKVQYQQLGWVDFWSLKSSQQSASKQCMVKVNTYEVQMSDEIKRILSNDQ